VGEYVIGIPLGDLIPASFVRRVNRFVIEVELSGRRTFSYIRDTGRMKDYLIPGNRVYLIEKESGKYRYLLRAVEGRPGLVLADPYLDNQMVRLWLEEKGFRVDTKGLKFGRSLFDLRFERGGRECVCEVKGSNMYYKGWAVFPDVYSSRAERHFRTLADMDGCRWLVFVSHFPTKRIGINPEFPNLSEIVEKGMQNGLEVHALSTRITGNTWWLEGEVSFSPVVRR